jgi:YD repeat-containing protein
VVRVHVESVTDSFGYVSTATHNFKFAEILTATDRNGQIVSNAYDNFGRLVSVIGPYEQGTGAATITFAYNPLAAVPWALTSHIDSFRSATDRIETALFTDGLKRVVQTKKDAAVSPQAGTAPIDVMAVSGRVTFDPFGRTVQQFYPVTEATGQQGTFNPAFDAVQPTVTAFDILDRITKVTIPDNTTTTTAYDFGADRAGQTQFRTTVTDARGVRKKLFRDVRTLITTANEFNNGGTAVFPTSYAYDPVRQITGVTDDQGNVTSVAYTCSAAASRSTALTPASPPSPTTSPTTSSPSRRRTCVPPASRSPTPTSSTGSRRSTIRPSRPTTSHTPMAPPHCGASPAIWWAASTTSPTAPARKTGNTARSARWSCRPGRSRSRAARSRPTRRSSPMTPGTASRARSIPTSRINFGGLEEKHLLFVGAQLGVLGPENTDEINLSSNELQDIFDKTRAKLNEAALVGDPSLYLKWQPDV